MFPTIDTQKRLSRVFTNEQASVLSEVIRENYEDLVKTSDFRELKAIVAELAEQQKQTSAEMRELAEQQKKTSAEMRELAEQQKKTSAEVRELAEQQKKTSAEVRELAEQQKKTSAAVEILVHELDQTRKEVKQTRKEVGGLATTVGYRLEDEAYKALPTLLLRDFDIQVRGKLTRGYLQDNEGNHLEVNIIGKGQQQGNSLLLIGEAKSQLSKRFVDEFIRKKLNRLPKKETIFPILVTYMITSPEVEEYVHTQGIALYYSYDF